MQLVAKVPAFEKALLIIDWFLPQDFIYGKQVRETPWQPSSAYFYLDIYTLRLKQKMIPSQNS